MSTGPVSYGNQNNQNLDVRRVYYTGTTAFARGATVQWNTQADFATFTKGPGIDVDLPGSTPDQSLFAGIVEDSSVGSTGGYIDIIVPHPGDVVWCKVAAGLDTGDGVVVQDKATAQGFADGGAYANTTDIGYNLMDEAASDNPFAADELAPILFTYGSAF